MPRKFELRKEVALAATPEQVWQAIATGPGLAAWFMPMEVDPGGADVIVWDPPRRLTIRTPETEDGPTQAFEYLVEGRDGGSAVLRFVHSGVLGEDWGAEYEAMTGHGWDMYLYTLAQYLQHFPGLPATYVEAEAPASTAQEDAWARLAPALGLHDHVVTGDRVHLELDGLAPIEGVVDYVTPTFLGVRTAAALLRFHGRAAIGMPIAVSHHIYSESVDHAAVEKGWQAWLAQLS
ncbi:MAG: SRPBCC domain-containing protein [Actinomycetota bacterium]|nr:SRPBCC domain-containing protein [Actinomycetota bacterium]